MLTENLGACYGAEMSLSQHRLFSLFIITTACHHDSPGDDSATTTTSDTPIPTSTVTIQAAEACDPDHVCADTLECEQPNCKATFGACIPVILCSENSDCLTVDGRPQTCGGFAFEAPPTQTCHWLCTNDNDCPQTFDLELRCSPCEIGCHPGSKGICLGECDG